MLLSRLLRPPLQSISLGLNINSRDLLWIRSSSRSLSLIICCWAEQSSPSTLEDLFCFSVKWLMFPLMFWKNVKLGFLFWVFQKKLRGLDSAQNCSLKHLLKKQLVFYLKKSPITFRQGFSYHQMTDISVSVNVLLLYRRSFSRSAFPIIHNRCRWQCLAIEIVICRCWSCWVSKKKIQEVRIYT